MPNELIAKLIQLVLGVFANQNAISFQSIANEKNYP